MMMSWVLGVQGGGNNIARDLEVSSEYYSYQK